MEEEETDRRYGRRLEMGKVKRAYQMRKKNVEMGEQREEVGEDVKRIRERLRPRRMMKRKR